MLDKRLKHSINKLCDESSVQLQECLTVNRITNAKGIKLVSLACSAYSCSCLQILLQVQSCHEGAL